MICNSCGTDDEYWHELESDCIRALGRDLSLLRAMFDKHVESPVPTPVPYFDESTGQHKE